MVILAERFSSLYDNLGIIVCYCYNPGNHENNRKTIPNGTTQSRINGDLSVGSPEEHCTQCM